MGEPIPQHLKELTLGILTIIWDRGGNATKTKLLKLLYLADLEHFRDVGKTLTGFNWIFHFYGPWTDQYDALLDQLLAEDLISVTQWAQRGLDGFSIQGKDRGTLDDLGLTLSAKLAIQESAETWASEPTGELLNYVYFNTEPMQNAERGKPLDFTTVQPRKELPVYRRRPSGADEKTLRQARKRLEEKQAASASQRTQKYFTPPRYDEIFYAGMNIPDEELD